MRPIISIFLLSAMVIGIFAASAHYGKLQYCERAEWHFWNRKAARDCRAQAIAEMEALRPYIARARARGFSDEEALGVARLERNADLREEECRRGPSACPQGFLPWVRLE